MVAAAASGRGGQCCLGTEFVKQRGLCARVHAERRKHVRVATRLREQRDERAERIEME